MLFASIQITGANSDQTIQYSNGAPTQGSASAVIAVDSSKGIMPMPITVISADGSANDTYELYMIRTKANVESVTINGQTVTATGSAYVYTVPDGASTVRVGVKANNEYAQVSINNGKMAYLENERDVKVIFFFYYMVTSLIYT